jgi:hypothetical protein
MMTTNVDNKASGASARHFHIALRSGNDDYNNYRQQRTTSVEWQGLSARENIFSLRHVVATKTTKSSALATCQT